MAKRGVSSVDIRINIADDEGHGCFIDCEMQLPRGTTSAVAIVRAVNKEVPRMVADLLPYYRHRR